MKSDFLARVEDRKLYADIFNLICDHAKKSHKILKMARFKYNPDGSLCKGMTFEWHFKKVKNKKQ